jgi:hypothetical protein
MRPAVVLLAAAVAAAIAGSPTRSGGRSGRTPPQAIEQGDPPPDRRGRDLPEPGRSHPARRRCLGRTDRRMDRTTPLHGSGDPHQGPPHACRRRPRPEHSRIRTRPRGNRRRVTSTRIYTVIVFYTITVDVAEPVNAPDELSDELSDNRGARRWTTADNYESFDEISRPTVAAPAAGEFRSGRRGKPDPLSAWRPPFRKRLMSNGTEPTPAPMIRGFRE